MTHDPADGVEGLEQAANNRNNNEADQQQQQSDECVITIRM
jgi:hypothetical protein